MTSEHASHETKTQKIEKPKQAFSAESGQELEAPQPTLDLTPRNMLYLQRTIGNHAAQRLLSRQADTQSQKSGQSSAQVQQAGGVADEGGIATDQILSAEIHNILSDWQVMALQGINQFVHAALNNRINEMKAANWMSFITALAGNIVWALAAFETGGAAFAISMAGIDLGTAGNIPAPEDSSKAIIAIENTMNAIIIAIFTKLNGQRQTLAKDIVDKNPSITLNRALVEFLQHNFKPGEYGDNIEKDNNNKDTYPNLPTINQDHILAKYTQEATELFDNYINQVQPIGEERHGTFEGTPYHKTACWISGTSKKTASKVKALALVTILAGGIRYRFETWIAPNFKDMAIEKAKAGQFDDRVIPPDVLEKAGIPVEIETKDMNEIDLGDAREEFDAVLNGGKCPSHMTCEYE